MGVDRIGMDRTGVECDGTEAKTAQIQRPVPLCTQTLADSKTMNNHHKRTTNRLLLLSTELPSVSQSLKQYLPWKSIGKKSISHEMNTFGCQLRGTMLILNDPANHQ